MTWSATGGPYAEKGVSRSTSPDGAKTIYRYDGTRWLASATGDIVVGSYGDFAIEPAYDAVIDSNKNATLSITK